MASESKVVESPPTRVIRPVNYKLAFIPPIAGTKNLSRAVYSHKRIDELLKGYTRGEFTGLELQVIPMPTAKDFTTHIIGVWSADSVEIETVEEAYIHPGNFTINITDADLAVKSFPCPFEHLGLSTAVKPAPLEMSRAKLTIFFWSALNGADRFPDKIENVGDNVATLLIKCSINPGGYQAV